MRRHSSPHWITDRLCQMCLRTCDHRYKFRLLLRVRYCWSDPCTSRGSHRVHFQNNPLPVNIAYSSPQNRVHVIHLPHDVEKARSVYIDLLTWNNQNENRKDNPSSLGSSFWRLRYVGVRLMGNYQVRVERDKWWCKNAIINPQNFETSAIYQSIMKHRKQRALRPGSPSSQPWSARPSHLLPCHHLHTHPTHLHRQVHRQHSYPRLNLLPHPSRPSSVH